MTWNNQPGSVAVTSAGTVEWEWAQFTVTSTVQGWVNTLSTNYGFKLHENGNGATYWKRLISYEQGSNRPSLVVTYHRPIATPAATNWTSSRTRSWTYSDPHPQSHYQVEVSTSSAFTSILSSSGVVAGASTSWAIPAGVTLTSGSEYWWRIKVKDGTGWSDWATSSFLWDTAAPSGTLVLNGGAASTDSSAVRVSLTGADPGTSNGYTNDGRSLAGLALGCSGVVSCGSGWLSPQLAANHATGAIASVGTGSTGSWNALTVDAYTNSNRSTLAMDVMRETAGDVLVGVVSDDHDGLRYQLRADASGIHTLEYTTTATPGVYTTESLAWAFTPGVWYRLVAAPAGGTPGTYNLWWYPRDQAQPASPTRVTAGVYLPKPRLHLWQKGGTSVYLDNLKTSTNAASPWGSGISAVRFSSDNVNWGLWTGYADTLSYTLPAGNGSKTLYAQFRDAVGNVSASVSDAITVTPANYGRQRQHTFESWDLGAGDELAVNVAIGNLVLSHPLVTLPFRGDSLPLALTYNSQDTANVGLGAGWRLNLQRRLTLNGDNTVTFIDADGARHTFTNPVVVGSVTTYTRPPALYATLVKDTSQATEFTLTYRDQHRDRYDISGSEALLVRAEDRHANGVDLAYATGANISTLTDPAGRQLTFSWDTAPTPDLLTSLSDWAYVSGGVVQTTATGSHRQYRFFYSSGQLAGWSDPLNTAGSCPTGGSHLTCLTYTAGLLSAVTKTQTYTTLSGGALGTATRPATSQVTYAGSRVASVRDAEQTAQSGPSTSFTADQADRVVVRRPTTVTTYGLKATADSYARVESTWRQLDPLTEIERRTTWDSVFPTEPATVTDNYGALLGAPAVTLTYTYLGGSLGNLAKLVEPLTASPATNRWTEYTYNANNDVTEAKVSRDGSTSDRTITRYCYSSASTCPSAAGLDLLAEVQNYVDGIGGSGAGLDDNDTDVRTDYTYDAYGQRTDVTRHNRDAAGTLLDERHDRFEYDASGNLTAEIDNYADGSVTSPGDDITANATTLARTDLTTAHTYDTAGNRVSTADPRRAILAATGTPAVDDYISRWTFDALNQQLTETTPTTPGISTAQKTATSASDEFGLVRTATDFGGLVTASEVDRTGRVTRGFEDEDGAGATAAAVTAVATYDADGRTLTSKDRRQAADSSLGSTTHLYDPLGREAASTEADGTAVESTTLSAYDALDRRVGYEVGSEGSASPLTTYAYDLGGRVTATDDGFTCATDSYDYRDLPTATVMGRPTGCTGAGSYTVTHSHDGLSRRYRDERDDGSRTLSDVLDAAGDRRSSAPITLDSSGDPLPAATTTYTVNLLSQTVAELRDDGSSVKTTYDAAGNPVDVCTWAAGLTLSACLPAGTSPWTNPPSHAASSAWDALNQRVVLTDGTTNATTTYDPDHNYQPASVSIPTAGGKLQRTTYGYDDRHRLTAMTTVACPDAACASPSALGSSTYSYDDADNRTRVTESRAGGTPTDHYYCYDARNQLVYRNTGAACSASAKDETYAYDPSGNRTSANDGSTLSFTYTADGQLATVGSDSVTYDDAGRMITIPDGSGSSVITQAYDGEGRLTELCAFPCTGISEHWSFTYDADGRRTRIVTAGGSSSTTELRYLGSAISQEWVDGVLTRQYVTDPDGVVVKLVIPPGLPDEGSYLVNWNGHGDALNLVRILGDGSLEVANSYTYGSWGTPTTHLHGTYGDLKFRFLYVGREGVQWDAAAGLYLMGARHYSPRLGRFIQPDPAALEENPYEYASNNPGTKVDPSGLKDDRERGGGGAAGWKGATKKSPGPRPGVPQQLRRLFQSGLYRGMCVTEALRRVAAAGFDRIGGLRSGIGSLWRVGGAEVRFRWDVQRKQWQLTMQGTGGNFYDENGNGHVGPARTHIPLRRC